MSNTRRCRARSRRADRRKRPSREEPTSRMLVSSSPREGDQVADFKAARGLDGFSVSARSPAPHLAPPERRLTRWRSPRHHARSARECERSVPPPPTPLRQPSAAVGPTARSVPSHATTPSGTAIRSSAIQGSPTVVPSLLTTSPCRTAPSDADEPQHRSRL